jgi:hypothetical protein
MAVEQPFSLLEALRKLEASLDGQLCPHHVPPPQAHPQQGSPQRVLPQQVSPRQLSPQQLSPQQPAADRAYSHEAHAHQGYAQQAARQYAAEPNWGPDDDFESEPRRAHWAHRCALDWRDQLTLWWPQLRKVAMVGGMLGGLALVAMSALWWRLSSGPIELDIATPWLSAAIKENFGGGHEVEIGGTQLERAANGRTSLRILEIVVRDAEGTVVASAPKAEVGVSGWGLLTGRIKAQRLSLVGAEMAVRIEPDSKVTVFAGSNRRPFVTASATTHMPVATGALAPAKPERAAALASVAPPSAAPFDSAAPRGGVPDFAALIAWIESLDASGLDGRDLSEIGLKGGNLTVDDQRNGKQWTFSNIDLSVTRPKGGGIAVTLGSQGIERPWQLRAAMTPGQNGHRIVDIESQKISAKDLMLAMRLGDGPFEPELPLSGHIRADIGPDGIPRMLDGRILIEKGAIIDLDDPLGRIPIDRAEFNLDWDAVRRALVVPFQVVSGGNRVTLLAQFDAPRDASGTWAVKITGGTVMLAAATAGDPHSLVLNRVLVQLKVDPNRQRIDVEKGEVGNNDLGFALEGSLDLSTDDPRLVLGVAGTRMSVAALKRLWPVVVAPKVRAWVEEHVHAGIVEELSIATNAPWSTLKAGGPPVPDDGLMVQISGHGADIRPVEGLPGIRDADVNVRIAGRTVAINVGRGNVEIAPGRKLAITNGVFEVPDTHPKAPPSKARFRLDGSVQAAAELLATERLRDYSSMPLDPASSRGTITAQVALALPLKRDLAPGSATYSVNLDVANFSAERVVMGHKMEAGLLKISANNQGQWIRGDVKINGIPAALDYRKPRNADADVRVNATLDESARSKLGIDLSNFLSGPVPIKLSGKMAARETDSRFNIDADLTQAKLDQLFPGWSKPQGQAGRATFTLVDKPSGTRFEDLTIEAPGVSVKGSIEVDGAGEVVAASFPVFSLSDKDKATLKADRSPDGTLRVIVRGDLYDGRGFIKSSLTAGSKQKHDKDIDLEMKIGTVVGFHGETLRGLDLRLSRRNGTITGLAMNAKLGRDTPLIGDVRGRGNRPVVFVETNDAGAFFRFTDIYPKIVGGEMWVALDPQSADRAPQEGILNVRDFTVRGEAALERVAGTAAQQPGAPPAGVEFSRLRVDFTRSLGRFTIRDGLVKGPVIGATVDGYIDYHRNDVRMRGTFVPLYGLNNMFGQIPIFGLFLGGSNEGLLGVTYEVVGPTSAPVLRVNPISAVAPGLLRKFFEFPSANAPAVQSFADPARN